MRPIITFALTAVLAITFISCRKHNETKPQFVCYYGCVEYSYISEDSIKRSFQVYRDIECPQPVNEVWQKIHDTIVADAFRDSRSWIDTLNESRMQVLTVYPSVVIKDMEQAHAYGRNDYISLRTCCLTDSIYGFYCRTKWYDMGVHGSEHFLYRYFDLRTGDVIHFDDLLSNKSAVTHYLDSTIRQSEKAWGIQADTIRPIDNFIISDNGITFVYNQYEIGCYAIDTVMCTVPLSVFKPYIYSRWKYLWK